MRKLFVRSIVAMVLLACANSAHAIGWNSTDFLIGGGESFSNKIGVFDANLNFKGLLEDTYLGVGGMDFDADGHLVAPSYAHREVRVYDSSGARIGGFTNDALAASGILRVAPDGTYIIGQGNQFGAQGAVRFKSNGEFVRQYGDGNMGRLEIVAGDRLWSGNFDSPMVRVFDLASGVEEPPFTVAGLSGVGAIYYSTETNTVLFGHPLLGKILETDVSGLVIRSFQAPALASFSDIVRGPNGDIFASAATSAGEGILQWHSDGTFVREVSVAATLSHAAGMAWAGAVPEPHLGALAIVIAAVTGNRVRRTSVWR